ncbi:MAG: hypothetical protein IPJ76_12340 [Flavobacteriales bacterium]|nr:MAG: hypothetical protein IPJ76_12340 [Flavobacteriales bacterium]
MKTTRFLTIMATLSFSLAACEKEGPIGPQGEQGEQGLPGQDGSANVLSGECTFGEYNGGASNFDYTCNASYITQDIIDNGVVLGYVSTSGGWSPLNFFVPIGGELLMYRGYVEPGEYRVNMKFSDGSVIDAEDPLDSMNPLTVKVIAIEGGRMMTEDQIRTLAQAELAR